MMSDLIERFQAEIDRAMPMLSSPPKRTDAAVVLIDGMAKIEAQQAEIARLREALGELVAVEDCFIPVSMSHSEALDRARKALEQKL